MKVFMRTAASQALRSKSASLFSGSRTRAGLVVFSAVVLAGGSALAIASANQDDDNIPQAAASISEEARSNKAPVESDSSIVIQSQASSNTGPSTSRPSSGQNSNSTSVTVNGQDVPVPQNGSVHKTMRDGNNNTTIDVSTNNSTSATNSNSSSIRTTYSSDSEVDIKVDNDSTLEESP